MRVSRGGVRGSFGSGNLVEYREERANDSILLHPSPFSAASGPCPVGLRSSDPSGRRREGAVVGAIRSITGCCGYSGSTPEDFDGKEVEGGPPESRHGVFKTFSLRARDFCKSRPCHLTELFPSANCIRRAKFASGKPPRASKRSRSDHAPAKKLARTSS